MESTFGILANKWRILHRPIDVKPDFCGNIIKSCYVLHNYVQKNDGIQFDGTLYEGSLESVQPVGTRGSVGSIAVRRYFQRISLRYKGQFPGSVAKCNIRFLPATTFLSWK